MPTPLPVPSRPLLQSRKVRLALLSVVVTIGGLLGYDVDPTVALVLITAIIGLVIGGIAYEDAAAKGNERYIDPEVMVTHFDEGTLGANAPLGPVEMSLESSTQLEKDLDVVDAELLKKPTAEEIAARIATEEAEVAQNRKWAAEVKARAVKAKSDRDAAWEAEKAKAAVAALRDD